MNRFRSVLDLGPISVPHASGDEPELIRIGHRPNICSPREWGCTGLEVLPLERAGED